MQRKKIKDQIVFGTKQQGGQKKNLKKIKKT